MLPTARLELTKAGNPSEPEPAEAVFRLDVHQWLMSRATWLQAALNRLSLSLRVLQRRQWMSLKSFADLAFWEAQLPQYSITFSLKPLDRPYQHTEAVGAGERAYCRKLVTVTVTLSPQFSCKDFNSCILFVEHRGISLDSSILKLRPFVRYRA